MALDDIDMIDNVVVNHIIFNNGDSNDEVRGHTTSSRSTSSSFSNKSNELYSDQMQRESDIMVQDKPVTTSDSIQLEYATLVRQNQQVSKAAYTLSNTRNEHLQNITPICVDNTAENNSSIINIQLNYDINRALDQDL